MTSETWKNPCLAKQHNGQEKSAASVPECCFLSVRHLVSFFLLFLDRAKPKCLHCQIWHLQSDKLCHSVLTASQVDVWQFLYHSAISCLLELYEHNQSEANKDLSWLNMSKWCPPQTFFEPSKDAQSGVIAGDGKHLSSTTTIRRFHYNISNKKWLFSFHFLTGSQRQKKKRSLGWQRSQWCMLSHFLSCVRKQMQSVVVQLLTQTHNAFCQMFWQTAFGRSSENSERQKSPIVSSGGTAGVICGSSHTLPLPRPALLTNCFICCRV